MRTPHRLISFAALVASMGFVAFSQAEEPKKPDAEPAKIDNPAAPPSCDILDTLARAEKYQLFLKAVDSAGIEGELRKAGPFTVFVPTDEAFRKLPVATLDKLLADKARLTAILQGHVMSGKLSTEQLAETEAAKTLAHTTLKITPATADTPLKIEHANVVTSDLAATNGVVHAIDVLLMPK